MCTDQSVIDYIDYVTRIGNRCTLHHTHSVLCSCTLCHTLVIVASQPARPKYAFSTSLDDSAIILTISACVFWKATMLYIVPFLFKCL